MVIPDFSGTTIAAERAVSVEGVTRRFGRRWALRGVSLEVSIGEVVAIEGHNGSGKSTLLRVLSTALRATSGQVRLFGRDIREEPNWVRARVALMAYRPGLYEDLTARENLAFAAKMLGNGETRIGEVLERVGLDRDADERVRSFSSGMQRRLALGRLLLQAPRVLLLDEPYNSLDKEGVALVNEVVRDVVRGANGSAMIVLHDRQSAAGLLDRVVTMREGRLVEPLAPVVSAPAPAEELEPASEASE